PDAPSLDFTQTFTLSAWVNPSAFMQDPAQGGIISKVGGDIGNMGYQLYITGGNTRVGFQFNSPGQPWPGYQLFANAPVPPNQWTLITASYDQHDMKIYVNRTLAASRFIGPTTVATSGANFRISGDDNYNVHFAGLIDEVAVFNRAMSAKEIQDLYNGVTLSVPASHSATAAAPAVAPGALVANPAPLVSTLLGSGPQTV